MCGIIAYLGESEAVLRILIGGLKRLEYRGYDSAGVGVICKDDRRMVVVKKKGRVANLEAACAALSFPICAGIAHTRWATHGAPSDDNSHPQVCMGGDICLVHNGIIENYMSLKEQLEKKGFVFQSQTDSEVVVHLIDDVLKEYDVDLFEAVRLALTQVEGTFGMAVLSSRFPDQVIGARKGSPLIVGVGNLHNGRRDFFLASDASAIVEYTSQVVYMKDGDVVRLRRDASAHEIQTLEKVRVPRSIHRLSLKRTEIEKGGFKHFMLKEIFDQPRVLQECIRGRVSSASSSIKLGGLDGDPDIRKRLLSARRFVICACGTSWHAGLVGEYLLEHLARVPVEVEYASEFRYKRPILYPDSDVVLVISQSGETADTLAAVAEAKRCGVLTLGIVNCVGSTIAMETDAGVYLHAGPEIGVASTKAFTAQVLVMAMLSLWLGLARGVMTQEQHEEHLKALLEIPRQIEELIERNKDDIRSAAKVFRYAMNFLYLGRGFNFPVALEGALKLKEISYIHAEGYPAAEMKHGPIALIDAFMPVVFICPRSDSTYSKIKANVEEVLARRGSIIVITEDSNADFAGQAEYIFRVPRTLECFSPLLTVVPLQLLAYHVADLRGLDVDKPRNLAKSVTVE